MNMLYLVATKTIGGKKPLLEQIKVKIIPDSESISLAFENEELDLIYGRDIISLDNYSI
ncbi:hypothetical protein LSPH24S_03655 [Lysinibacillus sphaericus]